MNWFNRKQKQDNHNSSLNDIIVTNELACVNFEELQKLLLSTSNTDQQTIIVNDHTVDYKLSNGSLVIGNIKQIN